MGDVPIKFDLTFVDQHMWILQCIKDGLPAKDNCYLCVNLDAKDQCLGKGGKHVSFHFCTINITT